MCSLKVLYLEYTNISWYFLTIIIERASIKTANMHVISLIIVSLHRDVFSGFYINPLIRRLAHYDLNPCNTPNATLIIIFIISNDIYINSGYGWWIWMVELSIPIVVIRIFSFLQVISNCSMQLILLKMWWPWNILFELQDIALFITNVKGDVKEFGRKIHHQHE